MFKKGDKKIEGSGRGAGRPKGALNRGRACAAEICEKLNIDPLEALLSIAKRRSTPLDIKVDCLKAAAKFCHPALSTTAVLAKIDSVIDIRKSAERILANPELAEYAEKLSLALSEAGTSEVIEVARAEVEAAPELPDNPAESL
jgi:hypothetical protein